MVRRGTRFEWNVRLFGRERAMQSLEEAQWLQAAGRGKELMPVDLAPSARNIARVTGPVLLVYGTADRLVESEVGRRLKAAATKAPRADLVEIAGADPHFSTHRDELASTLERWPESRVAQSEPR